MAINQERVMEILRNCYDPEIPVNIVDLGLVYDVQVNDDASPRQDDAHIARVPCLHADQRSDQAAARRRGRSRSAGRGCLGPALEPQHDEQRREAKARDRSLVPFQLIAANRAEVGRQPVPRLGGLALPALATASAPGAEHPPG